VILTNQAGENAWPIAAATFVLMHRQPNAPAATNAALKFFAWTFAKGGKMAEELDYVPMPANVVGAVQKVWATQIKDPAGKPVYAISR
jgi:phosphate transport system substrate-binding protein